MVETRQERTKRNLLNCLDMHESREKIIRDSTGIITKNIDPDYKQGDFVFYVDYGKDISIAAPRSIIEIIRARKRGDSNLTKNTRYTVPKDYVEEVKLK